MHRLFSVLTFLCSFFLAHQPLNAMQAQRLRRALIPHDILNVLENPHKFMQEVPSLATRMSSTTLTDTDNNNMISMLIELAYNKQDATFTARVQHYIQEGFKDAATNTGLLVLMLMENSAGNNCLVIASTYGMHNLATAVVLELQKKHPILLGSISVKDLDLQGTITVSRDLLKKLRPLELIQSPRALALPAETKLIPHTLATGEILYVRHHDPSHRLWTTGPDGELIYRGFIQSCCQGFVAILDKGLTKARIPIIAPRPSFSTDDPLNLD